VARVIYPDGAQRTVTPAHGVSFTLEELRKLVGGSIELVALSTGDMMLINEEGKLLGLPYNPLATMLAAPSLFPGDYIAGPAVIISSRELGD
jgi:hypothetical protein